MSWVHRQHAVRQPSPEVRRLWTVAEPTAYARAKVGPPVACDGDVVELLRAQPRLGEAPGSRGGREPGGVVNARDPLLLRCGHEPPVDDNRRRGVAVVGVEPEDRRHPAILERVVMTNSRRRKRTRR